MEKEPHILFEKRGAVGIITLNRPRALNALTRGMCIGLAKNLASWADDPAIRAVAIRGAGTRAFCAGADVRAMYDASLAGSDGAGNLLADEYRVNAMIAAYPKPYIAMMSGIVMGGGAGVSVHGSHRLADDTLAFAMPESAIGFITDVGATHFLSRCPGETGLYLGLTGARIGLGDALSLGLMTHAVRAADHDLLLARLADGDSADAAIAACVFLPPPPRLDAQRPLIDRVFAAMSVEAILHGLARDDGDFARECAAILHTRSPRALKFIFRAIRSGKSLDLHDCLKMEYRVASRAVMEQDFREGIRATLVDRDGRPRWRPDSLASLSEPDIAGYFAPLGGRELVLP